MVTLQSGTWHVTPALMSLYRLGDLAMLIPMLILMQSIMSGQLHTQGLRVCRAVTVDLNITVPRI